MKDSRLRLIAIVFLCLLTTMPQLVGWSRSGANALYLGRIPSNPADTAAYYSNIEQARQGRLLFANQLTSEPQEPSQFHPLWLLTGWLAKLFGLTPPTAFQVTRLLALGIFVVTIDRLLVRLFSRTRARIVALVTICTSSGLGWLFAQQAYIGTDILSAPIDLWVDEANTFRSLSHSALFVVSQVLLLTIVWRVFVWTQNGRQRYDWLIGPSLALLGYIHPYDLITAGAVSAVWVTVWTFTARPARDRILQVIQQVAVLGVWLVPVAAYYYFGPLREPAVRGWFEQNITLSPKPLAVLIGYGLLWPLSILGASTHWKRYRWVAFVSTWIIVVMVCMYIPGLPIQRRLLSGVHIPLALLATLGLQWVIQRGIVPRWQTATLVLSLVFLATMNTKHLQADIRGILHPATLDYPVFISGDAWSAMKWIQSNTGSHDVIMASMWDGNAIAGLAGRPVVVAHGNQTVAANDRERDWERFRDGTTTPTDREEIVARLGVRWLYWTTEDQRVSEYRPGSDGSWRAAFTTPTVTVYSLQRQRSNLE